MVPREPGSPGGRKRQAVRSRTGRRAEELVATRLADAGWSVVARNVRIGRSELDLVAIDPGPPAALVVVEVRANRSSAFGRPEDRVGRDKLRAVYRGAVELRELGRVPDGPAIPGLPIRVDLVAVEDRPSLGRHVGGPICRHTRGLIA